MRKRALLLTLLLFAAVGVSVAVVAERADAVFAVRGGALALTEERLRQGPVELNGDWEFYPNRLLGPADFAAGRANASAVFVRVPDRPDPLLASGKANEVRYGTYRLRLRVDDAELLALKTGEIRSSRRIYLAGRLIEQEGQPRPDASYVPGVRPGVAFARLEPGPADLIVQVANFDIARGSGIREPLLLGTPEQVLRVRDAETRFDWILVSAMLIMGLYLLGWSLIRREDLHVALLAFFCGGAALFAMTHGEFTIYELAPRLSFPALIKLQYFSGFSALYALMLHISRSFPKLGRPGATRSFSVAAVIVLAGIAALPAPLLTRLDPIVTAVALAELFYVVYLLVTGILSRYAGSAYMIVTVLAILFETVFSLNRIENGGEDLPFMQAMPFVGVLGLALLMSSRYARAFRTNLSLTERLLVADRAKDEFLTQTSHEFRTPLHGIMNVAESVAERLPLLTPDEQRDRLRLIASTAKRLSALVHDILDRSLLKEDRLRIERSSVDVRSSVQVVLDVFGYMPRDESVLLRNEVPAELPPVWADENRLRQVLSNLVDNALKHSGGRLVRVAAALRNAQEGSDPVVHILVADDGVGIPEAKRRELNGTEEVYGGGIGLKLCKQLIELHGGTLLVEPGEQGGTTVRLTLPAAAKETGGGADASSVDSPGTARLSGRIPGTTEETILVVDDDEAGLRIVAGVLASSGYNVLTARGGEEALGALNRSPQLDLAIVDMFMPGLSGYELCARIRESYSMTELPVLMLTAAIQPDDSLLAFRAGANDVLDKPFDYKPFLMRVQSLLSTKRSAELAKRMELAFLQAQIKPHFIDNVLNTITALSYEDAAETREMIQAFSRFLRGSLSFRNLETLLPLSRELELVRAYVELERFRFEDRVRVVFELEDGPEVPVPPLLLQPLVENAIRHGITPRLEGGTVSIRVTRSEGGCEIEVRDDGVGFEPSRAALEAAGEERETSGVGLRNLRKRVKHVFGTELSIESAPGRGTSVRIRIPAAEPSVSAAPAAGAASTRR